LQWRFRKFPSVAFQVLNDGLGDLEAPFFNYALSKTRNFHFLEGHCDIEDELLIKRQSNLGRVPRAWTALAHFFVNICSVGATLSTNLKKADD